MLHLVHGNLDFAFLRGSFKSKRKIEDNVNLRR
jgi:hypothetical protein